MRTRLPNRPASRPRGPGLLPRALLLVLILGLLGGAGFLVRRQMTSAPPLMTDAGSVGIGEGAPGLNPVERFSLATYLQFRGADLASPAGPSTEPVIFTVAPGETGSDIASRLYSAGLILDPTLFTAYMRYHGLDAGIAAGEFRLSPSQTTPEIAAALGRALPEEIEVTIIEGWRMEQTAQALAASGLHFSADEFLALARSRIEGYSFSSDIPAGVGLEGFLFPDTYRFDPDSPPALVLERMLSNFDRRVTADIRAGAQAQGLTTFELLTLASIVEREAAVPDERPLIASVYLNRLALGMKLEADPTVQYAAGYQPATGEWWKRPLTLDDLNFDSPYNTYAYPGLPPSPIASPGLSSIQAVAFPTSSNYLFFRAACDGSGRHNFSLTYEEHLAYGCP